VRILLASVGLATLCACSTPTVYTKTIEVRKDANGSVVETTITESMQQPSRAAKEIKMEHLGKRGETR
jgi:hypothetical protein